VGINSRTWKPQSGYPGYQGCIRGIKQFLPRQATDVDMRLEHMNNTGVDKQILSHITAMSFYTLDTGLNKEIAS
jgi:hypothetical protein